MGIERGAYHPEIEAQLPQRRDDIDALEAELAGVGAEQKRLAKAVALRMTFPSWSWSCTSGRHGSRTSKRN